MAFKYSYRSPTPQSSSRLVEVVRTAHSAAVQPPIALRELDFIEPPPRDYFCPVSFDLLLQPQQTKCCGNHLSLAVTTRLQKEGKPCPMCNREEWSADLDKYHCRRVHQVRVRCWYKKYGCGWEGDMNEFKKHAHLCEKRPWECDYCRLRCTYGEGAGKHWPVCPKFPLPCPNGCEVGSVERCGMEQHRSVCPLEPVACEMKEFGCSVVVPRKELATHMRESELQHLTAMTALNLRLTRQLQQDNARLDQVMAQQQRDLEEQKLKMAALQAAMVEEQKKIRAEIDMKLDTQKHELKTEILKVEHAVHHLNQHTASGGIYAVIEIPEHLVTDQPLYSDPFYSFHHGYKFRLGLIVIPSEFYAKVHSLADMKRQQEEVSKTLSRGESYWQQVDKDCEREMQEQFKRIEEHYKHSNRDYYGRDHQTDPQTRMEETKKNLRCSKQQEKKIRLVTMGDDIKRREYQGRYKLFEMGYDIDLNSKEGVKWQVCTSSDCLVCRENRHGVPDWRQSMNNIQDWRLRYSSVSFVHQNGIGVLLHLMNGEYDDHLQWPVEVKVQLELLNQAGDHHHLMKTKNITLTREKRGKDDEHLFKFFPRKMYQMPPYSFGVDLNEKNARYLLDTCLKIRVVITYC